MYTPAERMDRLTIGGTVSSMASSSGAPSAAVFGAREPTADDFQSMDTLQDIFTWAKIKGLIGYLPSQSATLLAAVGGDDDTSIEELAAIPPDRFLAAMENTWTYSESNELDDGLSTDTNVKPNEMKLAHAVSAHHVARLWCGVESSRAAKARRLEQAEASESTYRFAKLEALQATAVASGAPRPAATTVETAAINEVADTTQRREVPIMDPQTYTKWCKNYKK